MKTIELMSTEPRSVRAADRLDAAARVMWEGDCGLVPVVDGEGVVVGVITDRDVCMAAYTQGRRLVEIPVASVMARRVESCRADEPVANVLHRMQDSAVHRLPVVDARNHLVGVISTNDLVRAAHARPAAVDPAAVVRTLATIGAPRRKVMGPAARTPAAEPSAPRKRASAKKTATRKAPVKKAAAKKAAAKKAAGDKPTNRSRASGSAAGGTGARRQAARPAASGTRRAGRSRKKG